MSTDVDRLTRLQRAFAAAPPADVPRADCPSASTIWQGVHGELPPARLREIIHHISICTVCTEAWRLAEKLEEGSEERLQEGTVITLGSLRSSRFSWFRGSATAVAVVAVVALGIGIDRSDNAQIAHVVRGPGSHEIELLSKGPLPRGDFRLRWRGPDNARYKLRVSLAGDLISPPLAEEAALEVLEFQVLPEVLAGLQPNTRLLIYLEAVQPIDGRSLDSDTFPVLVQ